MQSQSSSHSPLSEYIDVIPQVDWESFQEAGVLTPLEKKRMEDVRMHTHLFDQLKQGVPTDFTVLNRLVSIVTEVCCVNGPDKRNFFQFFRSTHTTHLPLPIYIVALYDLL